MLLRFVPLIAEEINSQGWSIMDWITLFGNIVGFGCCAFLLVKVIPDLINQTKTLQDYHNTHLSEIQKQHKIERDEWREDIRQAYSKFNETASGFNQTVQEFIEAEQTTQHHLQTLETSVAGLVIKTGK